MTAVPAGRRTGTAAAVLAAVLALAGAALLVAAHRVERRTAAADRPLADRARAARVTDEVGRTLSRAFSYSAESLGSAGRTVPAGFGGAAAGQYETLVDRLAGLLAGRHLTVTAAVARIGVTDLTADRAELLVLLDQRAVRPDAGPATTAAQLVVTARLRAGRWQITDLTAL